MGVLNADGFPMGERRIQESGFAFIESGKVVLDGFPVQILKRLIPAQQFDRSGVSSGISKETPRQLVHNHPPTPSPFSGNPSTARVQGAAEEDE